MKNEKIEGCDEKIWFSAEKGLSLQAKLIE